MMPVSALPKYVQVAGEIKRKIQAGEYRPGDLLPSEHQLIAMFGVSRPTIISALTLLRTGGWIVTRQGKGSFVLAPLPDANTGTHRDMILSEITAAETSMPGENVLVQAGVRLAPERVTRVLGLEPGGGMLFARQRMLSGQDRPLRLASLWMPAGLAADAGLDAFSLLDCSVQDHLRKKNVMLGRVEERVLARKPTGEEADLLGIDSGSAVLNVLAAAIGSAGTPVLAVDVVRAGDDDFLHDAYRVTEAGHGAGL